MASQIYIFNVTKHNMLLKVHNPNTLRWIVHGKSAHSWRLPNNANRTLKYRIKHEGKVIAVIWINHNGLVTIIKNLTKRFSVMINRIHCDRFNYVQRPVCHVIEPQTIFITETPLLMEEKHHHHHHHRHHHRHHRCL